MSQPRPLELLAPAKNLACGIAAIDHGADAVYIGAPHHGARAAAANSIEDIETLCRYAHRFGAKVYVTLNTLIYENELQDAGQLVEQLRAIAVDAIIVQDMAMLTLARGMEMHASTQVDTRTPEKAQWLAAQGFSRVVLARELSTAEIARIHEATPQTELEVFVHGALCVSYSGLCYASQHCMGRSANRGACAQMCRMAYDLIDSDGRVIEHNRHLLSLRDLSLIDHLEELADAGATSFKIEGRLKDVAYVKNVVAAYSQRLNRIIKQHPEKYCRASRGVVDYRFTPNLNKTFSRGFTTYFLHGRQSNIASFDTPKAMGEFVGTVKELRRDSFNVASTAAFANGDGLCFFADEGASSLVGFRVNKAVGNRLYPFKMPKGLKPGTKLYRNHDMAFEKTLDSTTAVRKIPLRLTLSRIEGGYRLSTAEGVSATIDFEHQEARTPQADNIRTQLGKLGNTIYQLEELKLDDGVTNSFIPSGRLADLRRLLTEKLDAAAESPAVPNDTAKAVEETSEVQAHHWQPAYARHTYMHNVANHMAADFYRGQGLEGLQPAYEVERPAEAAKGGKGALLMQCRHCIRFALGYCERHGGRRPTWHEPLFLQLGDGTRFQLAFNCKECQMNVISCGGAS